jgi:hypothetical protein
MPPSTRDLLAEVLGERPLTSEASVVASPHSPSAATDSSPGPWRVTAQVHGGKVQISNNRESRVVPKAQLETYLRGHGPAVMPGR